MTVSRPIADIFDADELLALARQDLEKNQLDGALEKLKSILAGPQPAPEAIAMAARTYAQLGLFIRAQELFRRYLAVNPQALTEQFQLSMTHFNNGEIQAAQAMWEAILKQYPTHPPALFYNGLSLAQQGNTLEAKRNLEILLQSAAADNLYCGRGKELMQSIDAGLQANFAHDREADGKRQGEDSYQ